MAAKESETAVDNALKILIDKNMDICKEQVRILMKSNEPDFTCDLQVMIADIHIPEVDLTCYDQLLQGVMSC